ncbi:MAG: phenylacetate--CoA ligase [Candidatus Omnitrophota bacterium]
MIWNEKVECMNLEDLKNLQSERFQKLVGYVNEHSQFYRTKFQQAGVHLKNIRTIDDIQKLPLTTKDELREQYPFGLKATSLDRILETHVTSGTTGNPVAIGYTRADLDLWAEVVARALCCAGAVPGNMIQIAYGYGLFTGGLGLHYGALKMGLTIIPCSSGQTKRQLKLMRDFKPQILACTPSYALYMVEGALEEKMDPLESSWKIGIFGAEPWSEAMRTQIEKTWGMEATDIYGLCEIIGPGVAQECHHKKGLHLFSDVFYPEVLDPETNKPVADGESGVLVLTTLTKEGMPLVRYVTRDIVTMTKQKCPCGRTSPRISKIKGRTDDMIIVRGINVFPSQIEHILLNIEETHPHYQIIVDREARGLDQVEVMVEIKEEFFSDEIKKLSSIQERIEKRIESNLGISAKVRLVEPQTIARSEGKAKRVIDKRQL